MTRLKYKTEAVAIVIENLLNQQTDELFPMLEDTVDRETLMKAVDEMKGNIRERFPGITRDQERAAFTIAIERSIAYHRAQLERSRERVKELQKPLKSE